MSSRPPKHDTQARIRNTQRQLPTWTEKQPPSSKQEIIINLNTKPDIENQTITQAWNLLDNIERRVRHEDKRAGITFTFFGIVVPLIATWTPNLDSSRVTMLLFLLYILLMAIILTASLTYRAKSSLFISEETYSMSDYKYSIFRDQDTYAENLLDLLADSDELANRLAHEIQAQAKLADYKASATRSGIKAAAFASFLFLLLMAIDNGLL